MEPMTSTTHITTVNTPTAPAHRAAVNGLAIVGFIALIIIGIGLAIYAARYIPTIVGNNGTANVYFSSIFGGDNKNDGKLEVVPISDATTTQTSATPVVVATTTVVTTTTTPAAPVTTTPAPTHDVTPTKAYPVGTGTVTPTTVTPYGSSDLALTLTTGYLTTADNSSFIASKNIPSGVRLAARIVVINQGTNVTGPWKLSATIPTRIRSNYTFTSDSLDSLNPGESRTFVIHTDSGEGKTGTFEVTVDPDNHVSESNESNNNTSVDVVVN